jgi:hypothetical protein
MTISRRGFLGAILASGIAPAVGTAGILMPVKKIIVPELVLPELVTQEVYVEAWGLQIERPNPMAYIATDDGRIHNAKHYNRRLSNDELRAVTESSGQEIVTISGYFKVPGGEWERISKTVPMSEAKAKGISMHYAIETLTGKKAFTVSAGVPTGPISSKSWQ